MINAAQYRSFAAKHIGPDSQETEEMLKYMKADSLQALIKETIPDDILASEDLDLPSAMSESEYLTFIDSVSKKNKVFRSYIGQGYYGTFTPSVIMRNVFENPSWYTQYTPYQAEISQGRLEALLNFQTIVSDLTGLPIANASLLDEGTAAAEAMAMFRDAVNKKRKKNPATKFFIDNHVFDHTVDVINGRAEPLDIEIVRGDFKTVEIDDTYFGALVQYPNSQGSVEDYTAFIEHSHEQNIFVCCASDLLALTMLKAPGTFGADAVVGNTQRFGVPMGAGGPHAAFFATTENFKRLIPGRIIGVSEDTQGNFALRMALQTREQHIKREKATSNICTAQALLAIMASFYGVFYGSEGLTEMAQDVHKRAVFAYHKLRDHYEIVNKHFFDTISIKADSNTIALIKQEAEKSEINLHYGDGFISFSMDETVSVQDTFDIVNVFLAIADVNLVSEVEKVDHFHIPNGLERDTDFMTHEVFKRYRNETEIMRYMKTLEKRDLSLTHSMIALGSCTMKLNAASELIPLSNAAWNRIHPFAPENQREGFLQVISELENYLSVITGFTACSLQPNSGAQGELAGLMTIRAYHHDRGDQHREVVLIPESAHGTNPASGIMAGMKVIVVKCDENGNIDVEDLRNKAEEHKDKLSALMVTYPSTHGVFETAIKEICQITHDNGGLVYMDGANMNAQVGYTSPGLIGADVCHLNLHKTFAIPHGGGGPGVGPICVNDKLKPYLPKHIHKSDNSEKAVNAIASAPYGSALILLISYAYIRMLGVQGLKKATELAICNANYMAARLEKHFELLYVGEKGRVAHELIVDLRPFKAVGVSAEDVAKRLIDYGFHSPTLSFPVAGTIMIEPTESENKEEIDRFCDALINIKAEIDEIANGDYPEDNNVLVNAPHTVTQLTADEWDFPYSRTKAAWPLDYIALGHKFWPVVTRVNNAQGDRNLICTCPPMEMYM